MIGLSREKDREISFHNFSTKEILSNILTAFGSSKDVKEATLFLKQNIIFWTKVSIFEQQMPTMM